MSEILAANKSRATRLVRPWMKRMPKSVKSLLSRLRLVKVVSDDSCCRPASPTPAWMSSKNQSQRRLRTVHKEYRNSSRWIKQVHVGKG